MISSTAEFNAVMGAAVQNALKVAIELAHKDLLDWIDKNLYGVYSPTDYSRTNALKSEWLVEANSMSASIEFNEGGAHQSIIGQWALGDALLDVLQGGYGAYNAKTGKPIPARPFWDTWMARADSEADNWVREGLAAQGLVVI